MSQFSVTNLLNMTEASVKNWLNSFDTVISDCDGVLWHHETALEDAPEVISMLQSLGKEVHIITNNGLKTHDEIWQQAQRLGYKVPKSNIITPTMTIVDYLKRHHFNKKVYVIGNAAISRQLTDAGIESYGCGPDALNATLSEYIAAIGKEDVTEVGAVIVGWDEHLSYVKILKACHILTVNKDSHFLATNLDAVHKYPSVVVPGTGSFVRAIEICANRKAIEMGKPNPDVLAALLTNGSFKPKRVLMIGDCCKIDVKFGKNVGMQTLLVGTGSYDLNKIQAMSESGIDDAFIPDYYLPKLGDLYRFQL